MTSHAVLIQDGYNIPCESGNRCHTFLSQACSSPQSRCQYPTERKTRPSVLPGLILPHGSKHGQIPTGGRNRTVTYARHAIHIPGFTVSSTSAARRIRPKHNNSVSPEIDRGNESPFRSELIAPQPLARSAGPVDSVSSAAPTSEVASTTTVGSTSSTFPTSSTQANPPGPPSIRAAVPWPALPQRPTWAS
jgi:hypothetical protein